ncbi:hypothetical protein [Pantoea endophytica]
MMNEERRKELVDFCENVLAAHVQWGGDSDEEDLYKFALSALTQPASPALRLPGEASLRDACHAVANATHESRVGSYQDGWNACIAEVKRLNAPHTAPIEPICATGGAEWTGNPLANDALIMLDRIDTSDSADDDRIAEVKRIVRLLAAAAED